MSTRKVESFVLPCRIYLGNTLTWEKGRQLKKLVKPDGTVIDYTYNANGIRTSKTVGEVKHTYTLDGTKILREVWGRNMLIPLYDNEDSVCGIIHNNVPYYFIKNLQGDVIAIVDKDAQTVARYSYDAWGVPTITQDTSDRQIATINPFRYRSYYYDEEIGLYYVSSRYYDSKTSQWVNSDDPLFIIIASNTQQYNTCCYCENSPIQKVDLLGCWAISLKTSSVAITLDVILTILALGAILFAPAKAISWASKIFSWAKNAFNKLINTISYALANSIDTILYELLKKYNSAEKVRITIGAGLIASFISKFIDLSPGNIVANLIDRFDKDGQSGYIRF